MPFCANLDRPTYTMVTDNLFKNEVRFHTIHAKVVVEAPFTLPSTSRPTRTPSDARNVQVLLEASSQATTLETQGFFYFPIKPSTQARSTSE
jgi:hypothetical protein